MSDTLVPARLLRLIAALAAAVVLFSAAAGGALLWTTWSWYRSVGAAEVLMTRVGSQAVTWLFATLIAGAALYVTALFAARASEPGRRFRGIALAVCLLLGALVSWNPATNWMTFRLAATQSPFGLADPLFGKDVGFFVFTLPALEITASWVNGIITAAFVVAAAVIFLPRIGGEMEVTEERRGRSATLFTVLFGVVMLSSAFGRWLNVWRLSYAEHSQLTGASYADVHAVLPAQWVMMGMSIIVAVVLFATASRRAWAVQLSSLAAWGLVAVIATGVWPTLVQTYSVAPNELRRERPYIQRTIRMTRAAFGLTDTRESGYGAAESLDTTAAASVASSLANARLWTPTTVKEAYSQLQTIRPYYRLSKIQTDRYTVNGVRQLVLVAARQIDPDALPKRAKTWVNQHLVYTHGYGLAISSASDTNPRGFPTFLVGDVPPAVGPEAASPGLETTEPRIYYGPEMDGYAIVNAGLDEFDYPDGEHNRTCRNLDTGGVEIGSGLERLAWAYRLGESQLLFSRYVDADSRLLLQRDIVTRAQLIAPWLDYREDPYPALVDGRVLWILDGFTSSDHFPYAEPLEDGTNYLRDSVKVTVDACSGETRLYAVGEDKVRDAWSRVFPGLIAPESEIPASLAEHFRYPRTLLKAQADVYRTFHMKDASVFYNKEDQWRITKDQGGDSTKPSYVTLTLPGSSKRGLYLIQPYSPVRRDNLIGWMAVGCDPEDYGEQTVFLLPKDHVVLGPRQVSARINQDPVISPQLSLWNQRGSKVLFGEMAVMPVGGAVAFVQPVFLQADESAMTELAGVVVVSGDQVVMERTLPLALARAFGAESAGGDVVGVLLTDAMAAKDRGDEAAYRSALERLKTALAEQPRAPATY